MNVIHANRCALIHAGMRHVLQQMNCQLNVMDTESLAEIKSLAATKPTQLVLIGSELIEQDDKFLQTFVEYSGTAIVIIAARLRTEQINTLNGQGVRGFVLHSMSCANIISVLTMVLGGGTFLPLPNASRRRTSRPQTMPALTQRQREVLHLMMQGLSNKSIARNLFVTEATIKGHVSAILATLGVNNRVQAIKTLLATDANFVT